MISCEEPPLTAFEFSVYQLHLGKEVRIRYMSFFLLFSEKHLQAYDIILGHHSGPKMARKILEIQQVWAAYSAPFTSKEATTNLRHQRQMSTNHLQNILINKFPMQINDFQLDRLIKCQLGRFWLYYYFFFTSYALLSSISFTNHH